MEMIINGVLRTERWTHIKNYKGLYEVSDFGRIRVAKTGLIRSPFITRDKYHRATLCKNGVKKNHRVHILVAKNHIRNPDPKNKTDVNHLNGDKSQNHRWNLKWDTHRDNVIHAYKTGLIKSKCKSHRL